VGRLFPTSPAGKAARVHLRGIRSARHTVTDEPTPMVNVFFGVQEDMNSIVDDLLDKFSQEDSQ
jgi:hypothetical protein